MKTKYKMIMDFAVEYGIAKINKAELKKIYNVRKCERVMLPYEILWSSRVALTVCGIDTNGFSSIKHAFSRGKESGKNGKHKHLVSRVVKRGENLHNREGKHVKIENDFKDEREWTW